MSRKPDGVTESLRVRVHPGLCEGWGNCHRWAPEVYPLDDGGRIDLHVLEVPPELAVDAWLGAEACPAGVIAVIDGTPVRFASRPDARTLEGRTLEGRTPEGRTPDRRTPDGSAPWELQGALHAR